MIERLRKRFILVTMASSVIVVALLCLGINVANLVSANQESDRLLAQILDRGALLPLEPPDKDRSPGADETAFSFRYLTVQLGQTGALVSSNLDRISTVGIGDLQPFVTLAGSVQPGFGDFGDFRYVVADEEDGRTAVFLERGREVQQLRSFAWASVGVGAAAIVLVYLVARLLSLKAIDPLVQNALEQRRFVTDASHELKTPLTVIGTSLSVLELESGESPWIEKAQRQVAQMGELVDELVTLSRMDEGSQARTATDFDAAATVRDVAGSFADAAQMQGHALQVRAPASLEFHGDEYALRKLCGILLDNALKHGAPGSPVSLALAGDRRCLTLTEQNAVDPQTGLAEEDMGRLFERFWRPDGSRSQTEGFGVGLALARSLCDASGGSIGASLVDGGTQIRFVAELRRA